MLNAILSRWTRPRASALLTGIGTVGEVRDGHWGDSLLQSLLRWIPIDGETAADAPRPNMPAARAAFTAALAGVQGETADELRGSILRCRGPRDLWHLRTWLYTEVARAHSQWEAERRLAALAALLPPQHAGLVFSDRDALRAH